MNESETEEGLGFDWGGRMVDPRTCPDDEVVEQIDLLFAGISARQRNLLRYVAEFDRRGRWKDDDARDMAHWLSAQLGISNWMARRWVAAAHALEHLPRISDALSSGRLGLDKALELTRFATPETEPKLITWARKVSVGAIRARAERATRPDIDDIKDAHRERSLRWRWSDDDQRLGLWGEFPPDQGVAITTAIKRLADQFADRGRDDLVAEFELDRDARDEQRCADALYVIASQAIGSDQDAERATVVVRTTLGAVLGAGEGGDPAFSELDRGPVIHPEVARRLSCDARLQFVVTDQAGNALGIGRASRNIPSWLMRELRFRDHGCTFPGCGTRAFLKGHHIRHWEDGGPTDLDNLVLTCFFHHKLVHEFGWKVRLRRGFTPEWFRPDGRRYDPGPDPPRQPALGPDLDLSTLYDDLVDIAV